MLHIHKAHSNGLGVAQSRGQIFRESFPPMDSSGVLCMVAVGSVWGVGLRRFELRLCRIDLLEMVGTWRIRCLLSGSLLVAMDHC